MRSFGICCLLWMILLSVWPCGDAQAFQFNQQDTKIAAGQEHRAEDECSPMCACLCCKTVLDDVAISHHQLDAVQYVLAQPAFQYHASLLSVHLDIWQPPKLG